MNIGDRVSWERKGLPPGDGVVSEIRIVEGIKVCMVRDITNALYAFTESSLNRVAD